ncbi:MAG: hypothetical protein FD180_978 [Planctomycetota bacterium]|nr:MAG: hypothetical protein FD180_978 [Planctomycetota bacterium]
MSAELQDLGMVLKLYQTDFGVYPPGPNAALVRTLQTAGQKGSPYGGILLEHVAPSGELLDRWQRPFVYKVGVKVRGGSALGFRLYSLGPNGADENGEGDDISVEN